ncbi:hypothetical protein E2C01_042436 [Portunus trituberculatus]|uniref:Uncharacterized protein n=1 Tax=Portunus trituberculatus TaxID=210409 RepID=A0A5B7FTM9_PORTR|nr:hypothetical protein [Portunus trituberculatus]
MTHALLRTHSSTNSSSLPPLYICSHESLTNTNQYDDGLPEESEDENLDSKDDEGNYDPEKDTEAPGDEESDAVSDDEESEKESFFLTTSDLHD